MAAKVTHELGRMDVDGREHIRARLVEIDGEPQVDLRMAYINTRRRIAETERGVTFPLARLADFQALVGRVGRAIDGQAPWRATARPPSGAGVVTRQANGLCAPAQTITRDTKEEGQQ